MPPIPPSEQTRPMTIEELAEITGHTPEEIAGKMADGTLDFMSSVEAEAMNYRLITAAPEMYELLKGLEWKAGETEFCQCCFRMKFEDHATDCRLAAVLKAVEGT